MTAFVLEDLQKIARNVITDSSILLAPSGRAADVPGWDSLAHTLIVLEINEKLGIALQPASAAKARDFAHLVQMVQNLAAAKK